MKEGGERGKEVEREVRGNKNIENLREKRKRGGKMKEREMKEEKLGVI